MISYREHGFTSSKADGITGLDGGRLDRIPGGGGTSTTSNVQRIRIGHGRDQFEAWTGLDWGDFTVITENIVSNKDEGMKANGPESKGDTTYRTYSQVFDHWPSTIRRPKRSESEKLNEPIQISLKTWEMTRTYSGRSRRTQGQSRARKRLQISY